MSQATEIEIAIANGVDPFGMPLNPADLEVYRSRDWGPSQLETMAAEIDELRQAMEAGAFDEVELEACR